jgi:hypothetical protein
MGISGSASFQSVRKSWHKARKHSVLGQKIQFGVAARTGKDDGGKIA